MGCSSSKASEPADNANRLEKYQTEKLPEPATAEDKGENNEKQIATKDEISSTPKAAEQNSPAVAAESDGLVMKSEGELGVAAVEAEESAASKRSDSDEDDNPLAAAMGEAVADHENRRKAGDTETFQVSV